MGVRRVGWALVRFCLACTLAFGAELVLGGEALAQTSSIATTRVTDTIYEADGTTATGTVLLSWPSFTTAGGSSVPAGSTSVTIGAGGLLSVQLVPNAGSTPMGSYYTAVYHLDDGSVTREYWVVPSQAAAVTVSAIKSTVLPTSVAMQTVSKSYVDTAIAAAVTGHPLDTTANPYVLKSGDSMTGPLVLSADPTAAMQASDKSYVDTQVAAVAAGIGQKVSTIPSGTQTVVQGPGTQLGVNNLNGVEYAGQYVTGGGSNGIANATASADCAAGCKVVAEPTYGSSEVSAATTWNNKTHVQDERGGATFESFLNPLPVQNAGLDAAKTIAIASTQSASDVLAATGNANILSTGLAISSEALAGGSNTFPNHIQATLPYFKTTYSGLLMTGNNFTVGQHILDNQSQDCYGVGDCLLGARFMRSSGGYRDDADEGTHPYDFSVSEDTRVFEGTCTTGCRSGATVLQIAATANAGTQGEGRYLLDLNPLKTIRTGTLIGGTASGRQPSALFTGTNFPVSILLQTAQTIPTRVNNIAPGTVTVAIVASGAPTGFATSTAALSANTGVACVADAAAQQALNFETVAYTVVDGSHLQMTLNRPHATGATVAVGGLCGYGLEQTVDTTAGIRQVFPVLASTSSTSLLYMGPALVGQGGYSSGYVDVNLVVASIARAGNVVTVTTATNFPEDLSGLTLTVQGVTDGSYNGSFVVTTTGPNTLTYADNGPNSTSAGGTLSVVTGGFVLYPMAEVTNVYNATTKAVDGQMTLAANTVSWATGDSVEMPHYFQELVTADVESVTQYAPRPISSIGGGMYYGGNNGPGLTGWLVQNGSPASSYFGNGGTHTVPSIGMNVTGVWRHSMELQAGEDAAIEVHCNSHGCDKWNSSYDLFQMDTSAGLDRMNYSPATSTLNFALRGTNYQFTPQGLTLGTLNVTTLNAGTINGSAGGGGSATVSRASVASAINDQTLNNVLLSGAHTNTPVAGGDNDTVIGVGAGASITSAREMTVYGAQACAAFSSSAGVVSGNPENGLGTCIGSQAGLMVSGGIDFTLVGQKALLNATSIDSSVSIGVHSGTGAGTSSHDVIVGALTLNDGSGKDVLSQNVVVGDGIANGSGNKSGNAIVGANAGSALSTASENAFFGSFIAPSATTASGNVLVGASSGPGLVGGGGNTMLGPYAGPSGDSSNIVAIGAYALNGVTSSNATTAIGYDVAARGGTTTLTTLIGDSVAQQSVVALDSVTVVGAQAGLHLAANGGTSLFGTKAGISLTTGNANNFFGHYAGYLLTTGSNNTAMGDFAGGGMTGGESGNEAFGANATTASGVSNAAQIGNGTNSVNGSLQFNGTQIVDGQQNLHHAVATPTQGSTCTAGAIVVSSSYIYACTAANTWARAALSSF